MRPVVKGLLIGCAAIVLIAGVLIAIGVRYVAKNKDKLMAQAGQVRADAQEFGRNATDSQCVAEGLSKYRVDASFTGQLKTRIWLDGCLEVSRPTPDFCSGVPLKSEFMKTVSWRLEECGKLGFPNDSQCGNLLTAVQDHCEKKGK